MWFFKKKAIKIESRINNLSWMTETSRRKATVTINHNIEYKYDYGNYIKYVDGKETMSANGFTFDEFMEDVFRHYPIGTLNQFYLVS